MSNVTFGNGVAYSTYLIETLLGKPFYNMDMGWGFSLLFTLSSQMM